MIGIDGDKEEGTPNETPSPLDIDNLEIEPFYYSVGSKEKDLRGKMYRQRNSGDVECFESHECISYRIGDCIYIDSSSNDPFIIGSIQSFKATKRDVIVVVSRYYRPYEVPEDSLSLMVSERGEGGDCTTKKREIFACDAQMTFPISSIRGHCKVHVVRDIVASRQLDLVREDNFFSCVTYNSESTRLASHSGEIRIGSSHQAKLPPDGICSVGEEKDRDELLWRGGLINIEHENRYIKLARTFRVCLLEQGNIYESERKARAHDLLLDDAITTLHRCNYSYGDALKEMNANDQLLSTDANFMSNEDTKKFTKGIKTLGKNFTRISRELLPLHSREQLVAFYYLWKKTPDAIKPKALNRGRINGALKRVKNGSTSRKDSRPPSRELIDYASASEAEVESYDDIKKSQYACHHCYGQESKDWHHAGKDHPMLLCTQCRIYYKKYGQMRAVDRPSTIPSCLFKRCHSDSDQEEEAGVRTRAGKKDGRKRSSSYVERDEGSPIDGDKKNGERKESIRGKKKKKEKKDNDDNDDDMKSINSSNDVSSPSNTIDYIKSIGDDEVEEKNVKKEVEEVEEGEGGEGGERKEEKMNDDDDDMCKPSTSNGIKDDNDMNEDEGKGSDNNESCEYVDMILPTFDYDCSFFIRSLLRGNDNSCSRCDIYFKSNKEKDDRRREITEEEKKKNSPPPSSSIQSIPTTSIPSISSIQSIPSTSTSSFSQVNTSNGFRRDNGLVQMNPMHIPPQQDLQNVLRNHALLSSLQQNGRYPIDPRHAAMLMTQVMDPNMMKQFQMKQVQDEIMRRQHESVRNGMNGNGSMNGMDPNIAQMIQRMAQSQQMAAQAQSQSSQMGNVPEGIDPSMLFRMQMEQMAQHMQQQSMAVQLQQQQQQHQQMIGQEGGGVEQIHEQSQSSSSNGGNDPFAVMLAQRQMELQLAHLNGMNPILQSEMLRQLQHESFRQ